MMTRRTFTGTLASAFAAAGTATAAGKLKLGIGTYTYHSLSIDDMIVQLKRLEIREIEMSRGEFMLFSKPAPEKFQSVKTKLDAAGIQCVSYYTATIKTDTDLDNAVRFAHLLGSRNITGQSISVCGYVQALSNPLPRTE